MSTTKRDTRTQLGAFLAAYLHEHPWLTKRDLVDAAHRAGLVVTPKEVNKVLYRDNGTFERREGQGAQPEWSVAPDGLRSGSQLSTPDETMAADKEEPSRLQLSTSGKWR